MLVLKTCQTLHLTPTILQSQNIDPLAHQPRYSQREEEGWRVAQREAEQIFVAEALRREKTHLLDLELRLARARVEVQEEVQGVVPEGEQEGDWEILRDRLLEERRVEVLAARHDSRQRLCHLLARAGQATVSRPSSSQGGSSSLVWRALKRCWRTPARWGRPPPLSGGGLPAGARGGGRRRRRGGKLEPVVRRRGGTCPCCWEPEVMVHCHHHHHTPHHQERVVRVRRRR